MANNNSIYCPKCESYTSIEILERSPKDVNGVLRYEIGECNQCNQNFLVGRMLTNGAIHHMWPKALPRTVSKSLPSALKADFEEALLCESVGAYRAAVTMARRALQGICLDQGAPAKREIADKSGTKRQIKNDLTKQIDYLLKGQIITAPLHKMAHEVRSVGNTGAHPEDAQDTEALGQKETAEIMALLDAFSQTLYVGPSILKSRIDDRTDKEQSE